MRRSALLETRLGLEPKSAVWQETFEGGNIHKSLNLRVIFSPQNILHAAPTYAINLAFCAAKSTDPQKFHPESFLLCSVSFFVNPTIFKSYFKTLIFLCPQSGDVIPLSSFKSPCCFEYTS
jgi:hypothetical protein